VRRIDPSQLFLNTASSRITSPEFMGNISGEICHTAYIRDNIQPSNSTCHITIASSRRKQTWKERAEYHKGGDYEEDRDNRG